MRRVSLVLMFVVFFFVSGAGPAYSDDFSVSNCSEFYSFGSVFINARLKYDTVFPGERFQLEGRIGNANDFPLVDGSVFVRIKKRIFDSETANRDGMSTVDEFFAIEDIALPANEDVPFELFWEVPSDFSAGQYEAELFYLIGKRTEFLGISSTDGRVSGSRYQFSVSGSGKSGPFLRKESVKVGGEEYVPRAILKRFGTDEMADIEFILENPLGMPAEVLLSYELCEGAIGWEGCPGGKRHSEMVSLAVGESKTLRHSVSPDDFMGRSSVLLITAQYGGAKSILNVRILRAESTIPHLGFVGMTTYPIREGSGNTMFGCVQFAESDDFVISVRILDASGNPIGKERYATDVPKNGDAVSLDFSSDRFIPDVTLQTEIRDGEQVVDSYSVTYRCKDIDPESCSQDSASLGSERDASGLTNYESRFGGSMFLDIMKLAISSISIIAFLVIVIVIYMRIKKKDSRKGKRFFVIVISIISAGLFLPSASEAKVTAWNQAFDLDLYHYGGVFFEGWRLGLVDPNVTVTYVATIRDGATGNEIADGTSVPVGSTIRFETDTPPPNWYGRYYWGGLINPALFNFPTDPEGLLEASWNENAESPSSICDIARYCIGWKWILIDFMFYFNYLSINPPAVTIDTTASTAGLTESSPGRYLVTSPGSVVAKVTFSDTYGKFYYDWTEIIGVLINILFDKCTNWGSNQPMRLDGASSGYELPIPEQKIDFFVNATPSPSLHLCVNGSELTDVAIAFGDSRSLQTFYGSDDSGTVCLATGGNVDVTAVTTFAESGQDAVTLSGNGTSAVSIVAKNPDTGAGKQIPVETVTASYSGNTKLVSVTVIESCSSDCTSQASAHCQGEEFTVVDSCGESADCTGTRSCDMNWKEVVPGF